MVNAQAKTAEAVRKSIEHCLEAYDYTHDYLTIDRLELDLGVFDADELLNEMPEKLNSELQKILSSYPLKMNHFEDATNISATSMDNDSTAQVSKRKTNQVVKYSAVDAFVFFLQQGYLPWWFSSEPAWNPEWIKKLPEKNWQELRNFLTANFEKDVNDKNALVRLTSQFDDPFLVNLLHRLQLKDPVEEAWNWLLHFYSTIQKTETNLNYAGSLPSLAVLRKHFWEKWIAYALGKSAVPELTSLLAPVKHPSFITSFLMDEVKRKEWMDSIPEFWRREITGFKHVEENRNPDSGTNVGLKEPTESEKSKAFPKATLNEEGDFILIPNSGLVLLHPFLTRLFEYCYWLNGNEFVNEEAKHRAVYALHYLATGDAVAPEYILMLPKLLCGLPLEEPIEIALPLSAAEKVACDEMLKQVIAHWKVLRNTSHTGLRETFLRRQGKLFLKDEKLRLRVQRKTEDILLNHLPWGFSMIKFSWMPRLLSVSWE